MNHRQRYAVKFIKIKRTVRIRKVEDYADKEAYFEPAMSYKGRLLNRPQGLHTNNDYARHNGPSETKHARFARPKSTRTEC